MKLYFHHFDIFKSIYKSNGQYIISPYLCESFNDEKFIKSISDQVKGGMEMEISYTNDLILNNVRLINELSKRNCYLMFFVSTLDYKNKFELFYDDWDEALKLEDLCFLGWDIYNNRDSAMIDGIYQINLDIDNNVYINNKNDINKWGLIPDLVTCNNYLEKNKNMVSIYVNGKKLKTHWEPVAIYCDRFTLNKLELLNS